MNAKPNLMLLAASGLLLGAGACRDRNETPKYVPLTGRVTSVNPSTGEVEMTYYNEKKKREMPVKGKLAPDAEILINGATARPEDVRTDDQVNVMGRIEKHGGESQLVAVKIRVTRPDTSSVPAGSQPGDG